MFLRKSIDIPLYTGKFDIVITDDMSAINKMYNYKIKHYIYGHSMVSYPKNSMYDHFVMILNFNYEHSNITHGVIAHEALHVTANILDNVGMKFDPDNHEAYTYIIQWVIDQVYEFLDKHNLQVSVTPIKQKVNNSI